MAKHFSVQLPRQRLSYSKKTKKWRKENVDFADQHSFYHNDKVRQSLQNKIANLNLYNGFVDSRDIQKVLNPYGLDASFVPDNIPHHPIMVPKIDLLVGEEINRRTDYTAVVTNPDAISRKEMEKRDFVKQVLAEIIQGSQDKDDKQIEAELVELDRDLKTWQDSRELMANRILKHYEAEQNFRIKFNNGFKKALIMGEEIYQVDIENNEPVLNELNPLKVRSVRSGNSSKVEDSDLIIIEDHWSPGRIIDVFYEELKPADIDSITEYSTAKSRGEYTDDANNHLFLRDTVEYNTVDDYLAIAELNGHYFKSDYTDAEGNIRVLRVYWKSQKKVLKVKYYDENGDVQYKLRSEEYVVDKLMGEEAETLWINECWEGTKIGKDIYINMRPRKVQYTKLNNPSYGHFGIIGEVYNTNQGRAVSLVDRMKNYQYFYDILWDRLNKGIQKNYGKILELDLASIPDNWEVDKWLHFAVVNGIAVKDSFKEGNKGAATGKLAGNMQASKGYLDLETGSYIQQHIQLLEYVKMEMGEIAGISKQREGQINNRETVGGVERSVNQSSHITEWWFMKHEDVKKRVLTAFLETAKIALKGNNKKIQYILDDQSIQILNLDGEEFSELDFGIAITGSSRTKELMETMKQLSQAFLQNGGSFSTVMDIYLSPSIADMRRKIERAEQDALEAQNAQAEQNNKIQEAMMKAEQEQRQADRDLKKYEADLKASTEIQKAIISATKDTGGDAIEDDGISNLEEEKVDISREKIKLDHLEKMKKLNQDWEIHLDKMKREDKKIAVSRTKSTSSSSSK